MALGPRFRRVAALDRRFVDREPILEAFDRELAAPTGTPRVINLVGVGGIGKSRLLRELRVRSENRQYRTAVLDLQVSAMRQQEQALAVLRKDFGRQEVRFDRFDIAYAVLWQRVHPNLSLSQAALPFQDESELLTDILDDASGLPVFGTAVGLAKLANRTRARRKQRKITDDDATLAKLDELPTGEVLDAVTYLFAGDLRESCADRPYAVFVDAYEALAPRQPHTGSAGDADVWLRDLIVQLDRGIVVVASREPLPWAEHEPEWERLIRRYPLHGLPMAACRELLTEGSIDDPAELTAFAHASQGLPFYLHLAMDTRNMASPGRDTVVSSDEILQRFLQHVEATEIRLLELLSVARLFDYEVFQALASAFDLLGDRLRWESLASYSFVFPAGQDMVRLHQLMAEALRARLSNEVTVDVHTVLQDIWHGRAQGDGTRRGATGLALRESAYHGVRAGRLDSAAVLEHADLAIHDSGKAAADGMVADLREHLAERDDPGLAEVARCLEAEAAVLVGNAPRAIELTSAHDEPRPRGRAQSRLALAGADAQRIGGATAEAQRIYAAVWEHGEGAERRKAGLWLADLHMCQGRMATAIALADALRSGCPSGDLASHGDVVRLLHLAHRFHLNLDTAATYLDEAHRLYEEAGSVVGLANLETNRMELLAWRDPAAVVSSAPSVVASQQELGALHELGKTHTALAIAQTRLGRTADAATSFATACHHLERARYRSGRARAELFRGALHLREGDADAAIASISWAVAELVSAEVYPTLILLAERLLARLEHADRDVRAAAAGARDTFEPIGPLTDLEQRIEDIASALLTDATTDPAVDGQGGVSLYDRALAQVDSASGYYNRNIRVDTTSGPVNVRIPIDGAETMDLRIWPESEVLAAVGRHVGHLPRLLHLSASPSFQVHEFIEGTVLDTVAPRGAAVPEHVPGDVVRLFAQLATVPKDALPPLPERWPADGDTAGFARTLADVTEQIHARFRDAYARHFAALGIPDRPLVPALDALSALRPRPSGCVHADVHRKNMIVHDGATVFLDWELTLWGDPLYDLAVHLHKMAYLPHEREIVVDGWLRALPAEYTANWETDLLAYLTHEQLKSAIVDTVRYSQAFVDPSRSPDPRPALVTKLARKLNDAYPHWRIRTPITEAEVEHALLRWAGER